MANRIRMYFAVFGDWPSPDSVSAVFGRRPTGFHAKGETIRKSAVVRKQSIWEIDSGLPEDSSVDEHLDSLLAILEKHDAGLRAVAGKSAVGIQCAAFWHTSQPGFHLSKDLLARVATLGISLDFDMYCMDESEVSEPVA
jgi:uncharacterized protein DUF4279